jgi:tetratricopeptide (TPR) repeat protein
MAITERRGPLGALPSRPIMARTAGDLTRRIKRLKSCLAEIRYRESAARWAREALEILESVSFKNAETRELLMRECPEDGTDTNEMAARCHVMLGKESFLIAERDFWKRAPSQDSPYLSCRIGGEEPYFAPAGKAMAACRAAGKGADYAPAARHFARANELFSDPWQRQTQRNVRLAAELDCDRCLPSFYLGMIALRKDDLAKARLHFKQVRQMPEMRTGPGAATRRQLRVTAGAFEAVAALLQGRLADAASVLKRARALDPQNLTVLRNQGYLYEQKGEPEEALSCYRAVLAREPQDGYARRRLAAAEAMAGRTAPAVIRLRKPSDFHAKFQEIAGALCEIHGRKDARRPIPEAVLGKLRLARRRVTQGKNARSSEAVRLPESVKTILRHDRHFSLWKGTRPLLHGIVRAVSGRSPVPSLDIDLLVRNDKWSRLAALKKLPKHVPVWNDDTDLPACIPLPAPGEQLLFLYMGEADENGEYPIARYASEPELWVAEASLIDLVVNEAISAGVRIECAFEFEILQRKAKKRNAKHCEQLSDHPLVKAIVDGR